MQVRDFTLVRWFLSHYASVLMASAVVSSWITVNHFSGGLFDLRKLQFTKIVQIEFYQTLVDTLV